MKTFLLQFAALLCLTGMVRAEKVVSVTADAAAAWLAETPAAQVVDVRTKEEFDAGHVAGARLIPWTDEDFRVRASKELDKGKPMFVYCRTGRRSEEAVAALVELGFTDIRHLKGGITAWKEAGKSLTKPE
jgi:rhodanese-related sulfurtransferase